MDFFPDALGVIALIVGLWAILKNIIIK